MRRSGKSDEKRFLRLAAVGHDKVIVAEYSLQPVGSASFKAHPERLLELLRRDDLDLVVLDGREDIEEAIRKGLGKRSCAAPVIVVVPGLMDSNEEPSVGELLRCLAEQVEAARKEQSPTESIGPPGAEDPVQPEAEESAVRDLSQRQERLSHFLEERLRELRAQNRGSAGADEDDFLKEIS
jgi:hypothetical protein